MLSLRQLTRQGLVPFMHPILFLSHSRDFYRRNEKSVTHQYILYDSVVWTSLTTCKHHIFMCFLFFFSDTFSITSPNITKWNAMIFILRFIIWFIYLQFTDFLNHVLLLNTNLIYSQELKTNTEIFFFPSCLVIIYKYNIYIYCVYMYVYMHVYIYIITNIIMYLKISVHFSNFR